MLQQAVTSLTNTQQLFANVSDSNFITGYALYTSQGLLTLGMKLYAAHAICVIRNNYSNGRHCSMKQEANNNNNDSKQRAA